MRSSILSSILLHIIILMMAIVTLPIFNNPDLEIPPIVQVELIEISEKTNVPKVSKKQDEKEEKKVEEKKVEKINQPVMKPKIEKSNEKVKDPSENEEIVKNKIEQQMFENIPIKKPVIKKKDKFDPLKIAELIDKSKNTKTVEENIDDLEYDALDSADRNRLEKRRRIYANQNAQARHAAIKANKTGSSAEGLDTKPSYGSGGFITIENTTTYIQPIEV